jgi:DNA-damage-inducible protein J
MGYIEPFSEEGMATKTATVRARIEPGVKEEAERILEELGLSPTQALVAFYRAIIRQRGLPFALREPNATTKAAMLDARAGRVTRHAGVDAMFAALDAGAAAPARSTRAAGVRPRSVARSPRKDRRKAGKGR